MLGKLWECACLLGVLYLAYVAGSYHLLSHFH